MKNRLHLKCWSYATGNFYTWKICHSKYILHRHSIFVFFKMIVSESWYFRLVPWFAGKINSLPPRFLSLCSQPHVWMQAHKPRVQGRAIRLSCAQVHHPPTAKEGRIQDSREVCVSFYHNFPPKFPERRTNLVHTNAPPPPILHATEDCSGSSTCYTILSGYFEVVEEGKGMKENFFRSIYALVFERGMREDGSWWIGRGGAALSMFYCGSYMRTTWYSKSKAIPRHIFARKLGKFFAKIFFFFF